MSSSITFTGLGSGLDSSTIISQLMAIEKAPQDRIRKRLATEQSKVTALQQLNTSLAALQKSAESFSGASVWSRLSATSSSSAVKVTASSSATPATLAVTVTHVATAARTTSAGSAALGDVVTSASSLDVTLADGTTRSVALADGKLSTVISSLSSLKDASGTPLLSASAISDGAGGYRLVVDQRATGAGTLTVTEAGGAALLGGPDPTLTRAGSDATITAGGLSLTQRSNTFTALMPGVDVVLSPAAEGTTATLTISEDGAGRANALATFVSQINQVIDQIAATTSYGTVASTSGGAPATGAGALPGDVTLRAIADQLLGTIFPGGGSTLTTLASMGLDLDRSGHVTFDATRFQSAYQADPQGVQAAFIGTGGFTSRVATLAKLQSDPNTGALSMTLKSENTQIARYNDEIAGWDDRLADKQLALQRQYTALEVLLSRLQTQSSWLTTQLNSMSASQKG